MKTALITGSADGIGKALALELAKKSYTVHVLDRNSQYGEKVIEELKRINPKGRHEIFVVDLSTVEANKEFIDMYNKKFTSLDLLVLNANAMFKEVKLNSDGIDTGFTIGYLSRYMFSVGFDSLLYKTAGSRVLHIGGATLLKPIAFDKLDNPNYKGSTSTYMGFMANNLLVQFAAKEGLTKVPYEYMEPGIVNTNTVKNQNFMVRFISKMMGMIEPEESGKRIADYITSSSPATGNFYILGKHKTPKDKIINGRDTFHRLVEYSETKTGMVYDV